MKKIVKTAWSCWNKTDRFIAVFSTISIILLMCIICTSCQAQVPTDIPPFEYNDASGEDFDFDGGIMIYPDGVIDFIYHTQDNEYIIEYDDPDAFDPETSNMIYNRENDYYYIEIYCDSITFFEYLQYYNSLNGRKDSRFYEPSSTFFIEEDYLSDDTQYYKLVNYGKD